MIQNIYTFHQKFHADDSEFVKLVFLSQTHIADAFPSHGRGANGVTAERCVAISIAAATEQVSSGEVFMSFQ